MKEILEKEFGIKPKKIDIFYEAFTHQTFANENKIKYNYQRLEFLGDALIDSYVSIYLFNNFPHLDEGQMTLLRSRCVKKESLADLARRLKLNDLLRIGKGASNLKNNDSVLSDLFESFAAAIFIDQGTIALKGFLIPTVFKKINLICEQELKDYKTLFQELLQGQSRKIINYSTVLQNDKNFIATVQYDKKIFGKGFGHNKKSAEQAAAKNALDKLKKDDS